MWVEPSDHPCRPVARPLLAAGFSLALLIKQMRKQQRALAPGHRSTWAGQLDQAGTSGHRVAGFPLLLEAGQALPLLTLSPSPSSTGGS